MRPTSSSSKKRLLSFLYFSWISRLSLDFDEEPEGAGAGAAVEGVGADANEPITMSLSLFGGMALGAGGGVGTMRGEGEREREVMRESGRDSAKPPNPKVQNLKEARPSSNKQHKHNAMCCK